MRVNGDGAAVGEPWYASMNPAGNGNNPIILEILRQLERTDVEVYEIPYLSKTVKTGDVSQGLAYTGYAQDGVLDEGYLQLYNLTSTVSSSDTIYIDAKNSSSLSGKTTIPAYPNSIYTDAWLSNPVSAYQMIWNTPNILNPGEEMVFEFNSVLLNGLLTADFYNNGKGYPYGCADGESNCPKLYFMFSTECGPDLPDGISCDCVIAGCPQSQISAFGAWSSADGAEQFKNFLNLANEEWQIPTIHFAIFNINEFLKSSGDYKMRPARLERATLCLEVRFWENSKNM